MLCIVVELFSALWIKVLHRVRYRIFLIFGPGLVTVLCSSEYILSYDVLVVVLENITLVYSFH